MDIVISQEQGRVPVTVFRIKGRLDAASREKLEVQAQEAIATGKRNLLVDLSGVDFMSSAGLHALHHILDLLRADLSAEDKETVKKGLRDGTYKSPNLKLLNPNPHVLQTLQMAGFDMFLEIHHNLKDAVASF